MCLCQISPFLFVVLWFISKAISDFWHIFLLLPLFEPHFSNTFQFSFAGDICGGHCCDNKTETDVLRKSIKTFEGLIKHQLKSLKGLWESTYNIYKGKVEASICVRFGMSGNKLEWDSIILFLLPERGWKGAQLLPQNQSQFEEINLGNIWSFSYGFNKLPLCGCHLSVPGSIPHSLTHSLSHCGLQ